MPAHVFRSIARDRRQSLIALAIVLGVSEFADSFVISFWVGAAVFSVLFLAGAFWTGRGGIGGPILIGALCVFELESFPTWERSRIVDWIIQVPFVIVSAIALVVAIAVLKRAYDTRRAKKPGSLQRA